MADNEFKDNAIYVCANKECGSKNHTFFRCSFRGCDLNNGTAKKDDDCKTEQIALSFLNYINASKEQYPYKYVILNSQMRCGYVYTFNTLEHALQALADIANYEMSLYEVVAKYDENRCENGVGLKLAYSYDRHTKKVKYEEDEDIGLHIEWYLEGRKIVAPTD